jgi:type I restriction enzyme S subunit
VIWPLVKLGELVTIKGGGTPSKKVKEYWSGNIPWASVKDLKSSEISKTVDSITKLGVSKSATNIIPAGTILTATRMALGKFAINTIDMAINQDLKAIFVNDEAEVDRNFLIRFLESKAQYIDSEGKGATVKGITLEFLKSIEIPLPPLDEQKRIAEILDKADAIRRKRQQAINLADDFLRSVFLDMFGDPVTNPKRWGVKKFADIGTLDRGKSKHRPRNDPKLLGGNHPLIQTGDVANSKGYIKSYKSTYSDLGLKQSRKWSAGTLCITIAANIAKTGILTFDACFPDSVVGFKPNEQTTTEYVQVWIGFLQKVLEANAPESAQKNINLAILRDLDIPLPPINEQQKFSDIVEKLNELKLKAEEGQLTDEKVFNSLSQKAFAGEL